MFAEPQKMLASGSGMFAWRSFVLEDPLGTSLECSAVLGIQFEEAQERQ